MTNTIKLKKQYQDSPEAVAINLQNLINTTKYIPNNTNRLEIQQYENVFSWDESYVAQLSFLCKDRDQLDQIIEEGFSDDIDHTEFGIEFNDYYVNVGNLRLKESVFQ